MEMENPVTLLAEGLRLYAELTDEDIDYIERQLGQGWNLDMAGLPLVPGQDAEPADVSPVEGHQRTDTETDAAEKAVAEGSGQGSGSTGGAVDAWILQQRVEVDQFMEWIKREGIRSGFALASSSVFRQVRRSGPRSSGIMDPFPPAHNRDVAIAMTSSTPSRRHRGGRRASHIYPRDGRRGQCA